MVAFCHACNMTAFLGPRVSGWGDDSILSRMQHDCICSILEEHFRRLEVAMTLM